MRIEVAASEWEAKKGLIAPAIEKCLTQQAIMSVNRAQKLAPVVTGHLRSSIVGDAFPMSKDEHRMMIGSVLEYAPYVEYGTGERGKASGNASYKGHSEPISYTAGWIGMSGHPYLRPAIYDREKAIANALKRSIKEALE